MARISKDEWREKRDISFQEVIDRGTAAMACNDPAEQVRMLSNTLDAFMNHRDIFADERTLEMVPVGEYSLLKAIEQSSGAEQLKARWLEYLKLRPTHPFYLQAQADLAELKAEWHQDSWRERWKRSGFNPLHSLKESEKRHEAMEEVRELAERGKFEDAFGVLRAAHQELGMQLTAEDIRLSNGKNMLQEIKGLKDPQQVARLLELQKRLLPYARDSNASERGAGWSR